MKSPLMTNGNGLTLLCGSGETDGAANMVNQLGHAALARTGVGTHTATLDKNYGTMVSGIATVNAGTGDQIVGAVTHSAASGVSVLTITINDISGAALTDALNGPRLNWMAVFSDKFA